MIIIIIIGYCFYVVLRSSISKSYAVQLTLAISNSKRLSEILRDIRTSTYQNCRIEEKINRTTYLTNVYVI